MKSTNKSDYIELICKNLCKNYDTCDKNHIYINTISEKTSNIGCPVFMKKEDTINGN